VRLLRGFPITLKGEMLVELEQRVKTLEYEMKILKNEVQKTLLDIQEQVLIHYYPTLRTEETKPSEGLVQAIEALRSKQAKLEEAPDPPAAKKVTLNEMRGGAARPVQASPTFAANGALDQAAMIKLSGWASDSAAKIGKERTGKLVTLCGSRGILTPEVRDVLLRVASSSKAAAPGKTSANDMVGVILKLDELLGRAADVEEARGLVGQVNLG
jgi:hypothetical protein